MALMLKSVFEQTKKQYHLELLAGEGGLYHALRWLYFTEDVSNFSFLRGGELFVITGFSIQGEHGLYEWIETLISHQACGLILNTGKYIQREDISQAVIELCNRENFPLMSMPWEKHLSDVMQDYSHRIFSYTHTHDRLTYLFQLLLTDAKRYSPDDNTRLLSARFDPQGVYRIAVLEQEIPDEEHASTILTTVENQLNQMKSLSSVFSYHGKQVVVFHKESREEITRRLEAVLARLWNLFPDWKVFCGIGSEVCGIESLQKSYRNSVSALTFSRFRKRRSTCFDEMDLYRIFLTCTEQTILTDFSKLLKPLEEYDAKYGSQLVETLRIYLQCNGSVKLVSDKLFCHRNTTNYRMKKIKELLESELDSSEMMFKLQLAFHVQEYQTIFDL